MIAGWVVVVLLTVVVAPIVQELFFRGLLQGAFTRRIGAVPAYFVTALIFSFAHVLNEGPLAPFVLFPMALVLGYLRHPTGVASRLHAEHLGGDSDFGLYERQHDDAIIGSCDEA